MMRLKLIEKSIPHRHISTHNAISPLGSRKLSFRKLKGKENKSKDKNAKHIKNVN